MKCLSNPRRANLFKPLPALAMSVLVAGRAATAARRVDEGELSRLGFKVLVHPRAMADFIGFHFFLREADAVLGKQGHEGALQIARFHPAYEFAGSAPDDIANCTNRSPHPTLHLLREASIDRAVAAFPDAAAIYGRNVETLRRLGHEGWRRLWLAGPGRDPRRDGRVPEFTSLFLRARHHPDLRAAGFGSAGERELHREVVDPNLDFARLQLERRVGGGECGAATGQRRPAVTRVPDDRHGAVEFSSTGPQPNNDDRQIKVSIGSCSNASPVRGAWKITLVGTVVAGGSHPFSIINGEDATGPTFTDHTSPVNAEILTDTSSSRRVIAVASYNTRNAWASLAGPGSDASSGARSGISNVSSRGPRRSCSNPVKCPPITKPEIAAPVVAGGIDGYQAGRISAVAQLLPFAVAGKF